MRLPFLRFTVRRMMVMVGLVGISTWLVSTAVKVTRGPHELHHQALRADDGELCSVTHVLERAFWPRYWRALLGRPWPGSFRCSCQNEIEAQTGIHLILMDSSISGKDAVAYLYRGAVAMTKRDYDQAITENSEAIRLGARDAAAYTNRGVAWMQKGDYDQALADFEVAIRRAPRCAKAYWGRAGVWALKQDYDKAIADYTEAIRLDPTLVWQNPGYLDTLAAASAEAGDFDAAVKYQKMAVEQYQDEEERISARTRLALYREKKPYREAAR